MNELRSLEDLLKHEINELCVVEEQLIEVMPKLSERAGDQLLKMALENHLEQTKLQRERLDHICQMMSIQLNPDMSMSPIKGMLKVTNELMATDASQEAIDAGLIAAAQKIEHYEISAYGTAAHYAERLGHLEVANLLRQTLDEEKMADTKLNEIAKNSVNVKAMQQPNSES
jgi:ferritin-like metal-binding protein YciE